MFAVLARARFVGNAVKYDIHALAPIQVLGMAISRILGDSRKRAKKPCGQSKPRTLSPHVTEDHAVCSKDHRESKAAQAGQ
jgi:hypothetical protein